MVRQQTPTTSKVKNDTSARRRITRSQTKGRCKIEDILKEIDIEETPMVKPVEVKGEKIKKNGLRAKKLDFSSEDSGIAFKPRKLLTRSQLSKGDKYDKLHKEPENKKKPIREEIIELSPTEAEVIKTRKGKEKVQEKFELELQREQLKEAREEVLEAKLELDDFKQERKELTDLKK